MTPKTPQGFFKPGNNANPAGRPKGSRSKLASSFFNDVYALWEEQGEATLRRMAFHEPSKFAEMVAKLMPQKLEIETPTSGMSEERMMLMIELADKMLALKDKGPGASNAYEHLSQRGGEGGLLLSVGGEEGNGTSTNPTSLLALAPITDGGPPIEGQFAVVADTPGAEDEVDPESLF